MLHNFILLQKKERKKDLEFLHDVSVSLTLNLRVWGYSCTVLFSYKKTHLEFLHDVSVPLTLDPTRPMEAPEVRVPAIWRK